MAPRDLTIGSVRRHVVAQALPVLLTLLVQSLYALVNLAFVRALGEASVAGLSISFQSFFLVLAVSQVVSVAALARVSQCWGAGQRDEARAAFSTYAALGALLGAGASVAALLTAELYVGLFTEDPAVLSEGVAYYRTGALTYLFQLLLLVFGNALRATGDARTPMRFMLGSIILNIALDPLLIFGLGPVPALGIRGAAWATLLSQGTAVVLLALLLRRKGRDGALHWVRPVLRTDWLRELLTRGLPAGVQFFLMSAVMGLVLRGVRPHGASWTASAGGGFRVIQQTLLPIIALGQAAASIAGQNLGARLPGRARDAAEHAVRWALAYALCLALALFAVGDHLGVLFLDKETELPVAAIYFRWSVAMPVGVALTIVPTFVLQAAGQATRSLAAALVRVTVLAALLFWLVPALALGPEWIFGFASFSAVLEGLLCTTFLALFLRRLMAAAPPAPATRTGR